jgi:general stress protein YciG
MPKKKSVGEDPKFYGDLISQDRQHMSMIGSLGGAAMKAKDPGHYSRIGKKSGEVRRAKKAARLLAEEAQKKLE